MRIKKMNKFVKFITNDSAIAITLAPFGIYVKERYLNNKETINHEKIHWKQQIEMLILPFYLWYVIEWFIKLLKYGRSAYYAISFERESYIHDINIDYIKIRKKYSWIKYLNKIK